MHKVKYGDIPLQNEDFSKYLTLCMKSQSKK